MYAVVNTGGKQYKVQQGEVLRVEKIPGDIGSPVIFDRVLMFSDGENVQIGQPVLDDVAVQGHIVEQGRAKKIIVFKYKRRKRFRRKQGHRQEYTAVLIDTITTGTVKAKTSDKEAEAPEAEAKKAEPKTQKAAPKKETTAKTEAKKDAPQKAAAEKAPEKAEAKKADDPKTEAKASQPETQKAEKKDGDND
jgi:large subunit ribosomal protein L21